MRTLSNTLTGGLEKIDASSRRGKSGLSMRAILLGFIGVAALSVFEPYNQNVFENTMLIGNHLAISVLFVGLMLVLLVNPVLTLLPSARSPADWPRLFVSWLLLLIPAALVWHGPVDVGARPNPEEGLSGSVVGLVWALTGVGFFALGSWAYWLKRKRSNSVEGPDVTADPVIPAGLSIVILCAMAMIPALFSSALASWLDPDLDVTSTTAMRTAVSFSLVQLFFAATGVAGYRVLRRIPPLSAAEIVVVVTMMLTACGVIWSGFHRFWAHQLVAPFYHGQTFPRWAPLIQSIPEWLMPTKDPQNEEVVYNFYAGGSSVPWGIWLWTGLKWLPFLMSFFGGTFFLVALFRRQWEEAEKLSFPLATIALETLKPPEEGHVLNRMFRSKLFWWSTGIVVALQMLYGLSIYFPEVPRIVFKYDLFAVLETAPWRHLPPHIKAKDAFIAIVGVAFFLSTEMSFSLWASVVVLALVEMVSKSFQYPIQEQFPDQQIGAYVAYAGVIVFVARHHLATAFRAIWRPNHKPERANELLNERTAAIGFLLSVLVSVVWLSFAGLPVHLAMLVMLVLFGLGLVVGRIVAESGLPFVQYMFMPQGFIESIAGGLLTAKTHTLIHVTTVAPAGDAREALSPYLFNATRMADGVGRLRSRRTLLMLWMSALLLAFVLAGASQLSIVYDRGATLTDEYAGRMLPERNYKSSADFGDLLEQSDARFAQHRREQLTHVGIGAGTVLTLCFLRYRFLAWPLHPVGFLVAYTYPLQVFWLSLLIGWLCKWLVMKLGGVPAYRKLQPMFLAMIVGTVFSSVFWIVVKILSYSGGEQGKAILFLPS